jgi:hypothetical protein
VGTDRDEVFRAPCHCGAGAFVVEWCSKDNPWSVGGWYESSIECPRCKGEFTLEHRGANEDQVVLVRSADRAEREQRGREHYARARALLTGPARPILDAFVQVLAKQKSVAAVYRLVRDMGFFVVGTEGTFRRNWPGPATWVKNDVRPEHLPRIMARVGITDPAIDAEVAALANVWKASIDPAPVVAVVVPSIRGVRHT